LTEGPGKKDQTSGVKPLEIIREFYEPDTQAYTVLVRHGEQVAEKSLQIARQASEHSPDITFIEQAALLHDIGIIRVNAPDLGCFGEPAYICHGIIGREMLTAIGLDRHGLVCERHVGAGLKAEEIEQNGLPLPCRDMMPVTLEEKIIAYADKFFSKDPDKWDREKPFQAVVKQVERYGRRSLETFLSWAEMFGDR